MIEEEEEEGVLVCSEIFIMVDDYVVFLRGTRDMDDVDQSYIIYLTNVILERIQKDIYKKRKKEKKKKRNDIMPRNGKKRERTS